MRYFRQEILKEQLFKQGNSRVLKKTSKYKLIREDKVYKILDVPRGTIKYVSKELIEDFLELGAKEFNLKMSVFMGVEGGGEPPKPIPTYVQNSLLHVQSQNT